MKSLLFVLACGAAAAAGYDPLAAPAAEPKTLELVVRDTARRRSIPVLVYLPPQDASPRPVVLFSHGLGGSRQGSPYLGRHWAARGYAAVFLQHPGSDEAVWKGKPRAAMKRSMAQAASIGNFKARTKDVSAVLDQLAAWNGGAGHPLAGRLDLARVGMSGHSFGAVTTQAVSGEAFLGGMVTLVEPRIRAAIAFSPSAPRHGSAQRAFGGVRMPWLLMTGTKDGGVLGLGRATDPKSRLAVYDALPPGGKYQVVLDGAEHMAFTERESPTSARNPNHHRVILALSTAFWDAYLRGDEAAQAWLDGEGPRSVMEKADRWDRK